MAQTDILAFEGRAKKPKKSSQGTEMVGAVCSLHLAVEKMQRSCRLGGSPQRDLQLLETPSISPQIVVAVFAVTGGSSALSPSTGLLKLKQ